MLAAVAAGERGVVSSDLSAEPLAVGWGRGVGEKDWWMRCSRRTQQRRVIAMAK